MDGGVVDRCFAICLPPGCVRPQTFVDYWRHSYDWRAWEAKLNGMSQFTTHVGGVMLHFVHERSSRADAVPLLLLHGWPGSFFE